MQGTVLVHHGILGQKWGVRRYQNPDGTLTEEGRKRYGNNPYGSSYRIKKDSKAEYDSIRATYKNSIAVAKEQRKHDLNYSKEDYKNDVKKLNKFTENLIMRYAIMILKPGLIQPQRVKLQHSQLYQVPWAHWPLLVL